MNTLPKFPKFKRYAIPGDSVSVQVGALTVRATLEHDNDSRPEDSECYTLEQIAAWKREDWFFVGVVLSVHIGDRVLDDHAASLWAVDCNFMGSDNSYLSDVADELLPEALAAAKTACESWSLDIAVALETLSTIGDKS